MAYNKTSEERKWNYWKEQEENRNCTGRIDNNEDILRISPKRVFQNKKLQ